ncbi:MAG: CAP domain-containing protein [bacterium]|nr:CAP domain-containing protein [bacterium]
MRKYFLAFVFIFGCSFFIVNGTHAQSVASRLAGRILLQVQAHGEGWYVHPSELVRYYLGRPDDAFSIMRSTGLGITNVDLNRIATSDSSSSGDRILAKKLSGRILLQVQSKGEAWYVYPVDLKRYYLGRPADAFAIMRKLGLGITDNDLGAILKNSSTSVSSDIITDTISTKDYTADRATIISDLNNKRIGEGVSTVQESDALSIAAQAHADDMAKKGYFSLTSPDGTTVYDRILVAGYQAHTAGLWLDSVARVGDLIPKWVLQSPNDFSTVALNHNMREIGIGETVVDEKPTFIIILSLSKSDYLQNYIADLADISKVRNDMLARVNEERQKAGVAPLVLNDDQSSQNTGIGFLSYNDQLIAAAQNHADDMKTNGYYSHLSLDGSNIGNRVKAEGYDYAVVGENIAKGQRSVKEVMDGWMASQGHRENILNSTYTDFGMGLSFGENSNGYEILWTQAFGATH